MPILQKTLTELVGEISNVKPVHDLSAPNIDPALQINVIKGTKFDDSDRGPNANI